MSPGRRRWQPFFTAGLPLCVPGNANRLRALSWRAYPRSTSGWQKLSAWNITIPSCSSRWPRRSVDGPRSRSNTLPLDGRGFRWRVQWLGNVKSAERNWFPPPFWPLWSRNERNTRRGSKFLPSRPRVVDGKEHELFVNSTMVALISVSVWVDGWPSGQPSSFSLVSFPPRYVHHAGQPEPPTAALLTRSHPPFLEGKATL